jgi:single-stranded DNA-binding protein
MHRGRRIGVDGRLEWREWETTEQEKRQGVSIVADTVQFLDSPRGEGDGEGGTLDEEGDRALAGVGAEEKDLAF